MELPKNYDFMEAEKRITEFWEKEKIFAFNKKAKGKIYSIDTPPPTVSGKMHIGHSFSYSQQDFVARFRKMAGFNVFYPFGTDDNGLATERLIEKTKNVKAADMDRKEFVKLCLSTLEEIRPKYIQDWKRIGMSCDFNTSYTTIDDHCQRISQRSFIELYEAGREYRKDAPTMWCPECRTGISQVECQDKLLDSFFNDIIFKVDGQDLIIATTRPELLPACVAVFYHPDDKRYKHLEGKKAKVPLFDFEVPILPDKRADPEKGTGIVMCCTFGDQTDMEWQKAHNLPIKMAITHDGKMTEIAGKYKSWDIKTARKMMIEDMKDQKLLLSQQPIKHTVNVHERCGTEVEFIKSKQWFIKYLDLKDKFLEAGKQMNWYPEHMRSRYNNWINGLQWDWLISRQRYFGIPFPVWYCKNCDEIILAKKEDLPVDPLKDKPPVDKCPKCGSKEFIPEKDVLDTWATSSLTPEIAAELIPEMYDKLFPMSLRPQAHDIITFWLFNTVVKSQLHCNKNPWYDIMISGWALDPHGKKMSKSKGNVIEPQDIIEKYGADCLRFWAASSKLGEDLPYQEKDLVRGQRFITKLWNASKFAMMHLKDYKPKKSELEVIDKWILSKLNKIIKECTDSFMNYEYSKPKLETENFFWHVFCDNYLEIVKDRLYNPGNYDKKSVESAKYTLCTVMLDTLKLMAPITPYITEEIYQLYFSKLEECKSIHVSEWPAYEKEFDDEKSEKIGEVLVYAVGVARRAKAEKKVSLKSEVKKIILKAKISKKDFEKIEKDLTASTQVKEIVFEEIPKDSKEDYECDIFL